jgi:hypothetical protein
MKNKIKQWGIITLGDNWMYIIAGSVLIAIVVLATLGCSESVPLGRHDAEQCESDLLACEESEDNAWVVVNQCEEKLQTAHNGVDISNTDEKTDAFELCEIERSSWAAETLRVGGMLEQKSAEYEGLNDRYHDVYRALQSVPVDIVEKLCLAGNWEDWICEAIGHEVSE